MITVNLIREGIDKHRARELADHFVNFTLTPPLPVQRQPLTRNLIDKLADEGCFLGNIYEITAEIEAAHNIKEET